MQTFDTRSPITAILDIPAGRVLFTASDRTDTTVEVRPVDAGKGRDVRLANQTTVEYADGVLRIRAETSMRHQIFGPSGSVEVTVQLPTGSRVEARTASAEFRTVGRLGDIAYDSSHGTITVDEAASVRLTTAAGDVSVGHVDGSAEIRTSKGDIAVTEAARGVVTMRTDAGNLSIGAAPGVSVSLDAGTSYGRIVNSLTNGDGAHAELDIRATTSYGNITARSL
ncbi:DUF4097 family beta strand repeat-containing protein [Actinocatenispora rupis]|uniref:DUF4097 domain-containing protein n=1 Tax=Actinocatenispora rupis TaxID=519421 RepID=A0A8J3J994_9ACTN|nr:DUF4097 family beta strand repeat-containing protein [Actinocatenispora rupis]GID14200.1 hypothetical protein Aru02nite_50890 [Actinocatenispora rupis]